MSISINHISKNYGAVKAVEDVSFNISAGEVVGFLGPNGAGKSTLMKILTCYIPPASGTASVCGFNISTQPLEVRKNIGYLAENNPLYTEMYVKEYLHFIAGLHHLNDRKKRVGEMIEKVGLGPEQKKKIGALSKGYRQRVGLAQALIHNPEVLILDEPTSGLDPNQLHEIRTLIATLGKQKTVILSTHIMQEVEAVCQRIIIINKGKIVADNTPNELKNLQSGSIVIMVEFDKEVDSNKLSLLDGITGISSADNRSYQLTIKSSKDIRPEIFRFAVSNNLTVLTIRKEEEHLEDIFKMLTQLNSG